MIGIKPNPKLVLMLFLVPTALCRAQEVKFVDLTNLHPKTALRFQPGVPLCPPEQKTCVVNGFGGEMIENDKSPDPNDPHILGISIDRVSTTRLTLDPFEVGFRIVNTGSAPIDIPVWGDLSDLQPADPWQTFNYLSLSIIVELARPDEPGNYGTTGSALYGSLQRPETIVSLKPGRWVRVNATMKLNGYVPRPAANLLLCSDFWLQKNQFTPQPVGGFFQTTFLHPREAVNYFPPITVNFTPTTHTAAQP